MTAGEAAEHGDVVGLQQLVEHGLDALIGELGAAVGELAEDDTLTAVEHAVHLEDAHLAVDVVHRLLHLLDEEDEVLALGGVGLRAKVRREGADVATHERTRGLTRDVLLVSRKLVAGHLPQQQVAHQRAGGIGAALGQERAHGAVDAHHTGARQQSVQCRYVAEAITKYFFISFTYVC